MQAFWIGFSKKAEEQRDWSGVRGDVGRGLAVAGGGFLASAPAGVLFHKLQSRESPLSKEEARKFHRKVVRARGLRTRLELGTSAGNYNMLRDTVRVPENPTPSVLAHELGHAASMGKQWRSGGLAKALPVVKALGQGYSLGGPALMIASGNERLENAAPYAAAGLMVPTLAEEGAASLKGLRDIRRFKGEAAYRRAIPGLAAAYGTYLSRPLATGLLAKYLVSQKRKNQEAKGA